MTDDAGRLVEEAYQAFRDGELDRARELTEAYLEANPGDEGAEEFLHLIGEVRAGRRSVRWEDEDPGEQPFACLICGHEDHIRRQVMLNTRGLTFLDLEWLNQGARGMVCSRCGFVHAFVERPRSPWKPQGVTWPGTEPEMDPSTSETGASEDTAGPG